jgi:hypothetical protein
VAETITVQGQHYTKRNPWGVWGLALITFGIYGVVWYYKINDEARRFLRDEAIRPGIAVLAVLLGWIVIVPPFISYYRTAERIGRMQESVGIQQRIIPILGLLSALILGLHHVYDQSELNKVWDAATSATRSGAPLPPSSVPAVPPPPPVPNQPPTAPFTPPGPEEPSAGPATPPADTPSTEKPPSA